VLGAIFCRGEIASAGDGCVDLVVDGATPDWQITGIRNWGFPSDRWHLDFDRGACFADLLWYAVRGGQPPRPSAFF
jgi:hypothetical protein